MKPRQISRLSLAIIVSLVTLIFLTGIVQTFSHARAAKGPTNTPDFQTGYALDPTPTPQKTPVLKSADTTGVIALAIVIVAIILVGASWGRRKPRVGGKFNKV